MGYYIGYYTGYYMGSSSSRQQTADSNFSLLTAAGNRKK